jgi:hypothetical protein
MRNRKLKVQKREEMQNRIELKQNYNELQNAEKENNEIIREL